MESSAVFLLAADLVLLLHALFVAYLVLGLVLIVLGHFRGWTWIHSPWIRWTHLLGIVIVALQSWLSLVCPLTSLEMALRSKAGEAVYTGAFIAHWLESILYYRAPPWVFTVCYTLFGAAVAACWWLVPPRGDASLAPRVVRDPAPE
jgi:hypothetical protein